MRFNQTSNQRIINTKHKRASTAFMAESIFQNKSASNFPKPNKFLKKEKMKLSKEIMKRLKLRSSNSSYSVQRLKKEHYRSFSIKEKHKHIEELKRKRKPKDFPLPVSSISKKLKKAIEARL